MLRHDDDDDDLGSADCDARSLSKAGQVARRIDGSDKGALQARPFDFKHLPWTMSLASQEQIAVGLEVAHGTVSQAVAFICATSSDC